MIKFTQFRALAHALVQGIRIVCIWQWDSAFHEDSLNGGISKKGRKCSEQPKSFRLKANQNKMKQTETTGQNSTVHLIG